MRHSVFLAALCLAATTHPNAAHAVHSDTVERWTERVATFLQAGSGPALPADVSDRKHKRAGGASIAATSRPAQVPVVTARSGRP